MPTILEKIIAQKKLDVESAKNAVSLLELERQIATAPPVRDFLEAIKSSEKVSLIAEVKKASPSKGVIRADFDPVNIAIAYEQSGATCISVLTDETFFKGHLNYLKNIRQACLVPLLRKDFIIDPYQVLEARAAGADAVLLIAECLSPNQLGELLKLIESLTMTALVELHDPENVTTVVNSGAMLIGINNRDLTTFETNLGHCIRLRSEIPADRTVVGESGIFTPQDVRQLAFGNIDAMLVGESLMKAKDIGQAVKLLLA